MPAEIGLFEYRPALVVRSRYAPASATPHGIRRRQVNARDHNRSTTACRRRQDSTDLLLFPVAAYWFPASAYRFEVGTGAGAEFLVVL